MLDARRVKHRRLRRYLTRGDRRGLSAEWLPRIDRIVSMLNVAASPRELDLPGFRWHELKGDRKGVYSVRVSGNWSLTYRFDDNGPYDVDLEDYHGR